MDKISKEVDRTFEEKDNPSKEVDKICKEKDNHQSMDRTKKRGIEPPKAKDSHSYNTYIFAYSSAPKRFKLYFSERDMIVFHDLFSSCKDCSYSSLAFTLSIWYVASTNLIVGKS